MRMKSFEKEKAIGLRRKGMTYNEILEMIPVAKSTLSLWLHGVGLAKEQEQRITNRRILAQKKGARRQHEIRLKRQEEIYTQSANEIGAISKRELWLIGIALYWAEGAKQKEHNPSVGVDFSNSDPNMIVLFIKWLEECAEIERGLIRFEIYIHETCRHKIQEIVHFWTNQTKFPEHHFTHIYFKKDKINTKRKNTGILYYGVLRVSITASTAFNRRITGWTQGIVKNCGVV
jgi:hypothetical protein